jgi:small subunit ribosomal protein S1
MILHMIPNGRRWYNIDAQVAEADIKHFEDLLKTNLNTPKDRSLTTGVVTRIEDGHVWIDIKAKAEGVLSVEEFKLRGFGQEIRVGDKVQVWVQDASSMVDSPENNHGKEYSNISFAKAAQIRSWPELEKAYQNKQLVTGIILAKIPGGYVVVFPSNGGRGFLPISQADPQMARSPELLAKYKTTEHQYMIVRMERNWHIVLSRKELMLQENGVNGGVSETPKMPFQNSDRNKTNGSHRRSKH